MQKHLVYGQDERVMRWVCAQIGIEPFCRLVDIDGVLRPEYRAIGLEQGGELIAGTVFEDFSTTDVQMHVAAASPFAMSRRFLVASFYYPFVTAGLKRVTGLVPARNQRALDFDLHLGFRREGLIRRASPDGGDIVLLGMLREECKLIRGLNPCESTNT